MTRTICSISYRHLTARRPYRLRDSKEGKHGEGHFCAVFEMLPAPRDGYTLLPVRDMEERYKFSSQAPETVMHKETTGEKVADCLISEWNGNLAVGGLMGDAIPGSPGIFVCKDLDQRDAEGEVIRPATEPSAEELRIARDAQAIWCQALVMEAGEYAKSAKERQKIKRDVHGAAAIWLYGSAANEMYSWMRGEVQKFTADCPVCGTEVKPGAFKCLACGEVIDRVGYAAWQKAQKSEPEPEVALVGAGVGLGAAKEAPANFTQK